MFSSRIPYRWYGYATSAIALATTTWAKRSADDIPPAYPERLLRSLVALTLLAIPVMLATIVVASRDRAGRSSHALIGRLATMMGVVVLAAVFAAMDRLNDEGWQPALFGVPILLMGLPVTYWLTTAPERRSESTMIVLFIASVLAGVPYVAIAIEVCHWAASHGWPVSW